MSLILSGTNGLSDVDGSAATPAIRGTDANTGIAFPAADTVIVATGGTERTRVDSAGNMGVGFTPSASYSNSKNIQFQYATLNSDQQNGHANLTCNAYESENTIWSYVTSNPATRYQQTIGGVHAWHTAASGTAGNAITFTQAMTLDASGSLLVGTTTAGAGAGSGRLTVESNSAAISVPVAFSDLRADNSSSNMVYIVRKGAVVGSISTTNVSTVYNTSSDYRLKEDVEPMTGALEKVAALKPVTYKWKSNGSDGQGFIAHELAEVEAGCVTGEKDAVDADGNPVYQGIDTSFLVATLTAAIQELNAKFEAYKATHP